MGHSKAVFIVYSAATWLACNHVYIACEAHHSIKKKKKNRKNQNPPPKKKQNKNKNKQTKSKQKTNKQKKPKQKKKKKKKPTTDAQRMNRDALELSPGHLGSNSYGNRKILGHDRSLLTFLVYVSVILNNIRDVHPFQADTKGSTFIVVCFNWQTKLLDRREVTQLNLRRQQSVKSQHHKTMESQSETRQP